MGSKTVCNSCDTCNSCLTNCNSCNICNGSCQSSAQLISKKLGKFCFRCNQNQTNNINKRLEKDDLFLTDNEWNSLIQRLYDAYNLKGSPHQNYANGVYTYDTKDTRAGQTYNNVFMSANMYNGAIAKMRWTTEQSNTAGSYTKSAGNDGDIIKAEYFRDLEDYANTKFSSPYCDNCVSCQGCLSCNSCQSGQCKTTTISCCTCEGCNSGNTK